MPHFEQIPRRVNTNDSGLNLEIFAARFMSSCRMFHFDIGQPAPHLVQIAMNREGVNFRS
jgi:hypothetical protein